MIKYLKAFKFLFITFIVCISTQSWSWLTDSVAVVFSTYTISNFWLSEYFKIIEIRYGSALWSNFFSLLSISISISKST